MSDKKSDRSRRKGTNKNPAVEESLRDRFDSSKPQFRKEKEEHTKVVLDDRFSAVLTDPNFQLNVKDKYGRKKKKDEAKEELQNFYRTDASHDNRGTEKSPAEEPTELQPNRSESSDSEGEPDEDPASRIAYLTALSRGELDVSSSDDEDSSQASDDSSHASEGSGAVETAQTQGGVLDPSSREEEVNYTVEESPYLAATNLDWSNLRAVDILAILSSFTSPGAVKSVRVYLSDFGKEQLDKESRYGPGSLWVEDQPERAIDEGEERNDTIENDAESLDGDVSDDGDEGSYHDSGIDQEKLRAYEASKLKYYFAVVEFSSAKHADVAYKEVDGIEFEHSSATMDLRSIPVDELEGVVQDRTVRDEAKELPSKYVPPEFVVSALQQSSVQCSWEAGDHDRERTLTKYTSGEAWGDLANNDDLREYLASDVSSDESNGGKGSAMRKMLGLDDDGTEGSSESEMEDASDTEEKASRAVTFVPGANKLKEKIASKLVPSEKTQELTPWQKYQEKRKEKKREKRSLARSKRKEINEIRKPRSDSDVETKIPNTDSMSESNPQDPERMSKEELELLVAGDEEGMNYDMRALQRIEKNKDKKLRGSRKRKEDDLAAAAPGRDFAVDVSDSRFQVLLDGEDARFGIDRTDPNYKETPGMAEVLAEQSRRRKQKKQKKAKSGSSSVVPNVEVGPTAKQSAGSANLSAIVSRIKSKVVK